MEILNTVILTQGAPNIFVYFSQSNLAGKVIVLALILFSLLAWTVMIGKYIDLSRLRKLNLDLERRAGQARSLLKFDRDAIKVNRGPYAAMMREATDAYYRAYGGSISLSSRIGHVENALQRSLAQSCIRYESKMVLLGSIVTGAPFMGLLGTVWGVMDAFGGIATRSGASIQMLAPGVSGALLTTVAALLVAIPSVFGYNFLLTQTKVMITELESFASSLADGIELESREGGASE